MVVGHVYDDARRIYRNCRAAGLQAVSPFYDESLLKYLFVDLVERHYRAPSKLLARKAMDGILDERVVWRKDNQGLRSRPKNYVKANFEALQQFVRESSYAGKAESRVNSKFLRQISVAAFEHGFRR